MGFLTVNLDKVTDLRDADGVGLSDPYVMFELMQDNMVSDKSFGKKQSTKKNNDLNPVYNETFDFSGIPSMDNMVLLVKIMDDDVGRDGKLGSCKIKLEDLHLDGNPKKVEQGCDKKRATIHLKLSYRV